MINWYVFKASWIMWILKQSVKLSVYTQKEIVYMYNSDVLCIFHCINKHVYVQKYQSISYGELYS